MAKGDLPSVGDIQDSTGVQSGESAMSDNRWRSGRGRISSRDIPSLLEDLPPVGYHYPEQLEMRRGLPSNQPWDSAGWRDERGYPNDTHPMWDDRQSETYGEFRDGPWYNPAWEGMDHSRYHRKRDDDRYYSSRDTPRSYPNDHFSDGYAPGPRQRDSFEGDSGSRPRYDNHQPDLRDRITRRNSNSSLPSYNGQQKMKSVVGIFSRGSRPEGHSSSSHRHTTLSREDRRRRASLESTKKSPDSRNKSRQKNSSSSESPSGKSARKSKPRKLARSGEKKKDDSYSGDSGTKGSELERTKREETAITENGKSETESASALASFPVADDKSKSKTNMQSSNTISEGTASSIKLMADPKENTSSSSKSIPLSSAKRNSISSVKGFPSPPGKKGSTSVSKQISSTASKEDSSSASTKDSSSASRGDPSSQSKETPPLLTKRNSTSLGKRDSSSASKKDSSLSLAPSATKENSTPLEKGESSSSIKGVSSLAVKRDSSSTANGVISSSITEDFSSTAKNSSSFNVTGESSLAVKGNLLSLSNEGGASLDRGVSSAKGNSVPSLASGGSSLITTKEKKDPGKASSLLRDSLSSLKDKDKLKATSSEGEGELSLQFPEKQTLVASLDDKNKLSREEVNALPGLNGKSKDMPLPKMGEVSLSSTGDQNDQVSSTSFSRETRSTLPENGKERTANNQGANRSGESKQNDLTSSSAASAFVGSLPWGKREEELRTLLGIKKEPNDEQVNFYLICCN